jgi:threonine dehydratase
MSIPPEFKLVKEAKQRLKGQANVTPVLSSRTLNQMLGAEVFFKCENFQRVGAFKFRGAFNCIDRLGEAERNRGVVAFSSGNHAQAVARVGKLLGVETTIVMPVNAPTIKLEATKDYGARIVLYNPESESREDIAEQLASAHGYTVIPPFDHLDVICGQATAVMEMIEQTGEFDTLLVPCGGGGLLSGSAISARALSPGCRVVGIEPELADDATRSFYTKTLQTISYPDTIADGTRTLSLGEITFPLVLKYVDEMKTVSEQSIIEAVRFLFYRMKLVVEPSGALGLAALLSGAVVARGRIGVVLSGGNIDSSTMRFVLDTDKHADLTDY